MQFSAVHAPVSVSDEPAEFFGIGPDLTRGSCINERTIDERWCIIARGKAQGLDRIHYLRLKRLAYNFTAALSNRQAFLAQKIRRNRTLILPHSCYLLSTITTEL